MSAAPAVRRRRKHFDHAAFEELHAAVGKLDYTPDFNPSIEALINMPEVSLTERLLALIKLQAWGNQKRFAVHDDDRACDFSEAECARRLNVSRQSINRAVAKLIERNLLRVEEGRLYPVPDPEAERRRKDEVVTPVRTLSSPNLRLLKQRWFAEHPEIHEQYQKAFQVISEINQRIEAELNASVSATVVTDSPEDLSPRGGHEDANGADTDAPPLRTDEPPILIEEKRRIEEGEHPPPTPALETPGLDPEVLAAEPEYWRSFLFAARHVGMDLFEGDLASIQKEFEKLPLTEKRCAVEGIKERLDVGMFRPPGGDQSFAGNALWWIKSKKWTGDLKPRKGANSEDLFGLADARRAYDARRAKN
jgi:hypothetical protein